RFLLAVRDLGAGLGRHILVERAAERYVQHLDAAADRQHRYAAREREVQHRGLEGVTRRSDVVQRRMRRLAEPGRIHVAAAGQEEAVQLRAELLERRGGELRGQ